MNRYVVISSNGHPDYEFYVPIVRWAWKQFGWETICLRPFKLNGYREETVTQCMRLYAADYRGPAECLLMTSDADMIPLSDYWSPNPNDITVYGHDLTGYKHFPMCYIAMTSTKWREVMRLTGVIYDDMHRDLAETKAKSDKWEEWWQVDQDIIQDRLNYHAIFKVDRGIEPGSHLPLGRVDRAGMKWTQGAPIDFHAPKNPEAHRSAINEVLLRVFGVKYEKSDIFNYINSIQ